MVASNKTVVETDCFCTIKPGYRCLSTRPDTEKQGSWDKKYFT